MMKRPKPRGSMLLALLLALILPILAACGGQAAAPGASTQASPAAQPTSAAQAPAEQATSAPQADAPTAAPAAPAATAGTPATGGVLRISETTWPDSLDPQTASFSNEISVVELNYEGLTKLDKDLKTMPGAADTWEYNADATEITFHLRDGLKYSDGSPVTAQAFVNAAYRTLDPTAPGDYQSLISMIKGADAIIGTEVPTDEAKLPDLKKALGVTAVDDQTVKFTLSKPTPYFHTLASLWVLYPVKQDLIDQGGENWSLDPANQIGNGPFQISSIDQGSNTIEFKANENYWGGRPKLDGVQIKFIDDLSVAFQAYKNNEIDVFAPDPSDVPSIRADAVLGPEYHEYPGACTSAVEFNLTKAPFDNQKVREAFAYGFDREAYVRDARQGTSVETLTWIPPGFPGNDTAESRFKYDPDKAKALLAEAGFANGQGLPELKFTYASGNPGTQSRAEYLIQMYQKSMGITVQADPIEPTTLTNMTKSIDTTPAMRIGGWCADYPDPQNWLSVYWHSSQEFARNVGYKNEQVDKLLDEADVTLDEAKRADLYSQAQKIVVGDVAHVMAYNNKNWYLVKPYVKGLDFTPQDSNFPGEKTALINAVLEK
jgi:oligopeptide transport system substrate-binding protein